MKNTKGGSKGDGGRRVARVEQEIQKTVAQFLISGFRHPLPGLVTVARVMMPGDLRTAKVYISILGEEGDRKKAVETLNDRAFEVQNYIGKELRMRFCPKITFYLDDTTEHVLRIDRILHDLHKEKSTAGAETEPDSDSSDEES
jgi:ribosome-binding factor A